MNSLLKRKIDKLLHLSETHTDYEGYITREMFMSVLDIENIASITKILNAPTFGAYIGGGRGGQRVYIPLESAIDYVSQKYQTR